jgi:hypothetical protein
MNKTIDDGFTHLEVERLGWWGWFKLFNIMKYHGPSIYLLRQE